MRRETKIVGLFATALGLFTLALGVAALFGSSAPSSGLGCKVVCGLSLLAAELFGSKFGALTEGALWLAVGAAFTFFGVRVLRGGRSA
jgi:hypothetical protein